MATLTPPIAPSNEDDSSADEPIEDSKPEPDSVPTDSKESEQAQQATLAAYLEDKNTSFAEFIMGPLTHIKTVVLGSKTGILPTWAQQARRRHKYQEYARPARAKPMSTIASLKASIKTMAAQNSKLQIRAGKRSGGKRHRAASNLKK